MEDSQRLIINCGASQVTVSVVSISDGNLQIDKLVTEDLQYDFSNDDQLSALLLLHCENRSLVFRAGRYLPPISCM